MVIHLFIIYETIYLNTRSLNFTIEANVYGYDDFVLNWSRSFVKVAIS